MADYLRQALFFLIFSLTLWGCVENPIQEESKAPHNKYSLYIIDHEGNPYIIQTNNLDSGQIDPSQQNLSSNTEGMDRDVIVKDGFYYKLNFKKQVFTKYLNQNNTLKPLAEIALKDFYIENHNWVNSDTLLLFDLSLKEQIPVLNFITLDTKEMKATKGKTSLSFAQGNYNDISLGFSHIQNGILLLGYTYHRKTSNGYKATDTSYVAAFSYPSMKLLSTSKDSRTVHPGGENSVESSSFTDEIGDFYYLTCPGVAMGNYPEKPTTICRIKSNSTQIDTSYLFNISASPIQNHAYSIYYLGNKKAIIRNERKDLFTHWDQHWKVPHFEFHVVDLESKSIQKLKLPLDKGTRRQCVLTEGDHAYISINSESEGNFIWKYNIKSGKLTKGLKLTGPTSYILRLDRLN